MSDSLVNDNKVSFANDDAKIRRQHDLKIQAVKRLLTEWIDDIQVPGNHGTIILALLELGVERHLDHFDEQSAADLIQGVLRKVVQRRLGPLQ